MADSPLDQALDFIYSFIDYEKKRDPHVKITWDLNGLTCCSKNSVIRISSQKPCILPAVKARAAPRR